MGSKSTGCDCVAQFRTVPLSRLTCCAGCGESMSTAGVFDDVPPEDVLLNVCIDCCEKRVVALAARADGVSCNDSANGDAGGEPASAGDG